MTVGRVSNFTFSSGAKPKGKGRVGYMEGGNVDTSDYEKKMKDHDVFLTPADKKLRAKASELLLRMQLNKNRAKQYNEDEENLTRDGWKDGGKVKKGKR